MSVEIRMPELSSSMTEADLIAWLVGPGDRVAAGDVIAEIETDKSTVELEAEVGGVVAELRVAEGTTGVEVGAVLAVLDAEEAASAPRTAAPPKAAAEAPVSSAAPAEPEAPPGEPPAEAAAATSPPAPPASVAPQAEPDAGETDATAPGAAPPPTALARRVADQRGVDLAAVTGSGASGRITRDDVERAAGGAGAETGPIAERGGEPARTARDTGASADSDAPFELVPLTRMRRTIARRLSEAKQTVPHFYLRTECEVGPLLAARARLNAREDGTRVSVNDFVVRALALAMVEVPDANVAWSNEGILRFSRADIAVAVATDGGLVTPVVRAADRKGLQIIADEIRDLAGRARSGQLKPDEYRGGTFSVSNLGMYGIESVYPILNPPQAGILGVGAAEERPVVRDGEITVGRLMTCTLSADHRALDGAVGAQLLEAVKRRIEDPLAMLL